MPSKRQEFVRGGWLLLVLTVIAIAVYANSANHVFHLDDHHSIEQNPALRSLSRVPDYFVDPRTFSTLETNVDYRPVLQTSYALNYAMAGYHMPVWHATQVAIHLWCAFWLYLLALALIRACGVDDKEAVWTSVLVSLVFLVHPMNSGVVNYQAARSSELTAAFLLPAFYLDVVGRRRLALLFLLLALFTKVEAVAALAVFWALSVLRHRRPLAAPKEWLPYLGPVVFYWAVRQWAMTGIDFAGSAHEVGATRLGYLCTQITAWWVYLYQWFWPLHLVADNASYPHFHGLSDPLVKLALVGWALVCLALWRSAGARPYLPLLAFSALALLSPTSSVVPLAEMMNEHRPYLPVALLSIIFVTSVVRLALMVQGRGRAMLVVVVVLWLAGLGAMTRERNKVFLSAEAYWSDVLAKAPSARAHNNFGLTLMKAGRMVEARAAFEASLAFSPQYSTAHINLAIVEAGLGRLAQARRHYDLGVAYDRGAGEAHLWRGAFLLQQRQYREAAADLEVASKLSNDRYRVNAELAQAYAGLGQASKSADCALEAGRIDRARFGQDIVPIALPYFASKEQAAHGLAFFAALEAEMPDTWWVYANQAALLRKLGRSAEASAKDARALRLQR